MRGNVKRKYFSLELKWAEDVVSGIQPLCHALCECVVTKYLGCSDPPSGSCSFHPLKQQGCGRPAGGGRRLLVSALWLSLLMEMSSPERPGAVKGAPIGAAQRTLYREDRSAIMAEEGKQRTRFRAILKRGASQTDARVSTIVLSETRGL